MLRSVWIAAVIIWLIVLSLVAIGCQEKYVVGIVPVYTEENRNNSNLTIEDRINIEWSYREAVEKSKRYNRTVYPLYLDCDKSFIGFRNCTGVLSPSEDWEKNVRKFYADYFFSNKKDVRKFMLMNGVNLLVASSYIKDRVHNRYKIRLIVYKFLQGSKQSLTRRERRFEVPSLNDYEMLNAKCKQQLTDIVKAMERSNVEK